MSRLETFLMDPAAARAMVEEPLGRLSVRQTHRMPPGPFVLLDQVVRPLLRTGRVLLETAEGLVLHLPDGREITQAGTLEGRLIADPGQGALTSSLADLSPLRSFLAVGKGICENQWLALVDSEGKARCRLHLRLLAADTGAGLALVTLAALRGYDKAFRALRARVQALGGEPLVPRHLAQRLFPQPPGATPGGAVALAPDDPVLDVAVRIISAQLRVIRAREAGVIADLDTEFLHDYRVALRKIRSALGLFKGALAEDQTAALKRRFADLMAPTGRLRDLDVHLLERQTYRDLLPPGLHPGLDAKFAILARARTAERNRLVRHLRSPAYAAEITALDDLFRDRSGLVPGPRAQEPVRPYAAALIWKRYHRVGQRAATLGPLSPEDEVHELRIDAKKLRYLMEFFAPLFPGEEVRALLKPLKSLQDSLGVINDCAVQQTSLQDFLDRLGKGDRRQQLEVAQSVGALRAVLHRQLDEERARVGTSLAAFTGPDQNRRFRALFKTKGENRP